MGKFKMAAMSANNASAFTNDGHYLALLSVDGRLRIWETTSGKLRQEFTPSSHLETTCTCVCWTRVSSKRERNRKKKKRRKLEEDDQQDESDYPNLALGSQNGKIFLYSPIIGGLSHTFDNGHKRTVNGIVYCDTKSFLYSCSTDCNIIEWNTSSNKLESIWKADETSVETIALPPGNDTLLSAGKLIKLWDLKTKDILQTFNGHSNSISHLEFTCMINGGSNSSDVDGRYFVSGSKQDRIINVWQVNISTPQKQSVASYLLSDSPVCLDMSTQSSNHTTMKICVACQDGSIHFFESTLNSEYKMPIRSTKKMMIKCGEKPATFIKSKLTEQDQDLKLDLVSGPNYNPRFDVYYYSKLDALTDIKHDFPNNMLMQQNFSIIPQTEQASQKNSQVINECTLA